MKKTICALLALTMVLLCAGCGSGNNVNNNAGGSGVSDHGADGEASGNIYTDITGIAPDETLMEIDGSAIPAELYFYWLAYSCSSIEYQLLSAYNYYGAYGELVNEDNTIKWDADLTDGVTVGQFALLQAEDTLRFYAAIEAMADEQGVTLTEEDEAAIEASHEAAVEDLGSEEAFEEYLYQLGITQETFDRIATISHLFDRLTDLVLQEGSPLYLEEADYDQYGVYADHILLSTVDTATGEALRRHGFSPDLCPEIHTTQGLADALWNAAFPGQPMRLFRSRLGSQALTRQLAQRFLVEDVPLYSLRPAPTDPVPLQARLDNADYLIFSSASGVDFFLDTGVTLPPQLTCVCIGPVTARALAARSSAPFLTAPNVSSKSILQTLTEHWQTHANSPAMYRRPFGWRNPCG